MKAVSGSFLLQMTSMGLAFVTGITLARLLGAEQLGAYSLGMAWGTLLVIPSVGGVNSLLIRQMAIYSAREEWS